MNLASQPRWKGMHSLKLFGDREPRPARALRAGVCGGAIQTPKKGNFWETPRYRSGKGLKMEPEL